MIRGYDSGRSHLLPLEATQHTKKRQTQLFILQIGELSDSLFLKLFYVQYVLFLGVPTLFQLFPTGRVPFEEFQIQSTHKLIIIILPKGTGALGNLQIHVCSNLSSYSTCSVVSYYSQGGGPLGNSRFMFCILAYLSSP